MRHNLLQSQRGQQLPETTDRLEEHFLLWISKLVERMRCALLNRDLGPICRTFTPALQPVKYHRCKSVGQRPFAGITRPVLRYLRAVGRP